MSKITDLVTSWREIGPAEWAESPHGWIMPDGKPISLEPWQRAVLDAWWEHRDTTTTLAISNIKKTGKTTLNAILLAWRWLALPGEHYAAANDLDQSKGRQFAMIVDMVDRNPILRGKCSDTKSLLTFHPTGATVEAIEVDATGRAGSNHLTSSHTEAWGIVYESGIRAFEELTPPPGRRWGLPALRVCDSYAGWLDESVTWHSLVDRGKAGDRLPGDWPVFKNGGLLLFHIDGEEAQRRCFRGSAAQRKRYYGDQVADLRAGTYSRLHLNKRTSGEGRFVSPEVWEATLDPHCRPVQRIDRRPLWIGVDAGTKRDAAALVACTYNDQRDVVELVHVREWKPKLMTKITGGMDLDATIGDEIRWLDENAGRIREVRYDPWQMAALAQSLEKSGVNMVEMPQTAQRTEADQALYDSITSRKLRTFDSPKLTAAVRKAAGKETPRGFRLTKRSGDDLVVALSMAHFGASKGQSGGGGTVSYIEPGNVGRVVAPDAENNGRQRLNKYLRQWEREQARRKPKQAKLGRRR